jgi:NADH-quinone oxidoreductase subunit C/D
MATAFVVDHEIQHELGPGASPQTTCDGIPTFWLSRDEIHEVVQRLRYVVPQPFKMLYDLTAIDERGKRHRDGQPAGDFTVVYHLFSYERNSYVRLKVPLSGETLTLPSIVDICPAANWYEREVWDMFGIVFDGHPDPRRLLMPEDWDGYPLRKDYPVQIRKTPVSTEPLQVTAEEFRQNVERDRLTRT